jgi:hypothetical protein
MAGFVFEDELISGDVFSLAAAAVALFYWVNLFFNYNLKKYIKNILIIQINLLILVLFRVFPYSNVRCVFLLLVFWPRHLPSFQIDF